MVHDSKKKKKSSPSFTGLHVTKNVLTTKQGRIYYHNTSFSSWTSLKIENQKQSVYTNIRSLSAMIDDKFLGSKNSICYSTTLCVTFLLHTISCRRTFKGPYRGCTACIYSNSQLLHPNFLKCKKKKQGSSLYSYTVKTIRVKLYIWLVHTIHDVTICLVVITISCIGDLCFSICTF